MQKLIYLQNGIVHVKASTTSILLTFLFSFHLPPETDTHAICYPELRYQDITVSAEYTFCFESISTVYV